MSFVVRLLSVVLVATALTATSGTAIASTSPAAVVNGDDDDSWGWG